METASEYKAADNDPADPATTVGQCFGKGCPSNGGVVTSLIIGDSTGYTIL